ncbi:hypothetical protein BS47DRAFT_1352983 [Hydnum rufescens UP504]|uniref:Uncharacterized protein n=1 Tax=Hydnum rufescens UP504 TaxID=1448309 RepID=A0A9P6AJ32_9AGAM|nr:hypothetical protein BS47DRAFT_1352983 [Hydnum rufescens UP504]
MDEGYDGICNWPSNVMLKVPVQLIKVVKTTEMMGFSQDYRVVGGKVGFWRVHRCLFTS